jgi:hypothetical protein
MILVKISNSDIKLCVKIDISEVEIKTSYNDSYA